jgi:hypothetical protein
MSKVINKHLTINQIKHFLLLNWVSVDQNSYSIRIGLLLRVVLVNQKELHDKNESDLKINK